ncbi:MAG: response regulator [Gammaproteobacteria bacterium]|nr:MAG: response regulator [Gammaproteobacteria bacterium]
MRIVSDGKKGKSYLTPNDVARLLMVSPVTVRQWAQKGSLSALTTPGGHRRFLRHDVERFARERGVALQPPEGDALRILIVDDDKQLAGFLVELFANQDEPVSTQTAHDGFEAGAKVQTFRPHIMLLDLMMPELDGFGVCRQMQQDPNTKAVRIIAMTGYYTAGNVQRILAAGAEACLPKPLPNDDLLEAIGFSAGVVALV